METCGRMSTSERCAVRRPAIRLHISCWFRIRRNIRVAISCWRMGACQKVPARGTHIPGSEFIGRSFFTGCEPGKFPLLPLLRRAIESRRLTGELHGGRWYDIGTVERLEALDRELTRRQVSQGG